MRIKESPASLPITGLSVQTRGLTQEEGIGDLIPAQEEMIKGGQKLGELSASQGYPSLLCDTSPSLFPVPLKSKSHPFQIPQ